MPNDKYKCKDSDVENDGENSDGDEDQDTCDDCSVLGSPNTANDGDDNDLDGICDNGDTDKDNDTIQDSEDVEPEDAGRCQDLDGDTCDDCSVTMSGSNGDNIGPDITEDGLDTDGDGICDLGDNDDDNDGVFDAEDSDKNNPAV
eukprot:gene16174-biopygen2878